MSHIDKDGLQVALWAFQENCLPVVSMFGTDINHPCQPKALVIPYALEAVSRKNLQHAYALPAQKQRTEAHT
jgi:hypothetical protein